MVRKLNFSEKQFYRWKSFIDEIGLKGMVRRVKTDRKTTAAQMATLYNGGTEKSIYECTTLRTLKQFGYSVLAKYQKPRL